VSPLRFDFYKMFDVNTKESRTQFDQFVYKVVKGWVVVDDKKTRFSFRIPCFQRLLRVKLEISLEHNKLKVVAKDADYDLKKKYFTECAGQ
jgi:hypothetical protein